MANQVYANGREVACKAADGKSSAASPDVCFLPPDKTPASPLGVPTPLPNTAFAKDTTEGSKNVKISGKEIALKQKSYFKKSTGNEASKATQKKSFVTSTEEGKAYFNSWSMDVKFEGENVVRHVDLCTHNHGSMPGNTPTWPYVDQAKVGAVNTCKDDMDRVKESCPNRETAPEKDCEDPNCRNAKRCMLVPKNRDSKKGGCCPSQTGHHLIPEHCFSDVPGYKGGEAPCVCAEGWSWHRNDGSPFPKESKTHPAFHEIQDVLERRVIAAFPVLKRLGKLASLVDQQKPWKYMSARNIGVSAHLKVFDNPKCNAQCLKAQLDAYHTQPGVGLSEATPVRAKKYGNRDSPAHRASVAKWEDKLRAMLGKKK